MRPRSCATCWRTDAYRTGALFSAAGFAERCLERDLARPLRVVDERISVALDLGDRGVAMTLPFPDRFGLVPGEQGRQPLQPVARATRRRSCRDTAAGNTALHGRRHLCLPEARTGRARICRSRASPRDSASSNSKYGVLPRKLLQRDWQVNRWCRSPRIGSFLAKDDCGTTCSQLNGISASNCANSSMNASGPIARSSATTSAVGGSARPRCARHRVSIPRRQRTLPE